MQHGRRLPCSTKFSTTLSTVIFSTETFIFLKQVTFLKSFNSVLLSIFLPLGLLGNIVNRNGQRKTFTQDEDPELHARIINLVQFKSYKAPSRAENTLKRRPMGHTSKFGYSSRISDLDSTDDESHRKSTVTF